MSKLSPLAWWEASGAAISRRESEGPGWPSCLQKPDWGSGVGLRVGEGLGSVVWELVTQAVVWGAEAAHAESQAPP